MEGETEQLEGEGEKDCQSVRLGRFGMLVVLSVKACRRVSAIRKMRTRRSCAICAENERK